MGNWITSTFLRFDSYLFARKHDRFIDFNRREHPSNPLYSVRAAAEIVAQQRMKPDRNGSDTDFSDDDDCPPMTRQEEQEMYEREQRIAFSGRCNIGDPESCKQLRTQIISRCGPGPSTSTTQFLLNRDINPMRRSGAPPMSDRERRALTNVFLPNRRKRVDKVQTKTFCVQYINNGRKIMVSSQDERIRFYAKNTPQGKYSSRYFQCNELHVDSCSWSILDTAVNPEGDLICYSTWRDQIYLGKLDQHEYQNMTWHPIDLGDHGQNQVAVFCVRFSNNSEQLVCGTSDYSIHVFDVEQRRRVRTIVNAHEDDVNSVCFAEQGSNLIYSAGDDGLVKVWDKRAWSDGDVEPVGVFAGHRDGVTFVDSRQDEKYLLSNSKDQTIKVWDLRKFSNNVGVEATRSCVQSQRWDYRWQPAPPGLCQPVNGDTSVMTLRGHSVLHTLVRAKFSPERTGRRYIYTGCARGEVVVYDILTGMVSRRLKGHVGVVRECDWHPEENEIVSSSWDGITSVWTWDERSEHVTAPYEHRGDYAKLGDEDSCDEFYEEIKKPPRRQRKHMSRGSEPSTSAAAN
ncbi:unnamed protein product [Caenorhabditis sp. 36 PRJEB53466]|nr:unnamed protein product [Caenorhabditis sp. 36 PRJEB53466]